MEETLFGRGDEEPAAAADVQDHDQLMVAPDVAEGSNAAAPDPQQPTPVVFSLVVPNGAVSAGDSSMNLGRGGGTTTTSLMLDIDGKAVPIPAGLVVFSLIFYWSLGIVLIN